MLEPDTSAEPVPARSEKREALLARTRQSRILRTLGAEGAVTVRGLASAFGVSEMTIRRDLMVLEREGRLERTHGGAVPTSGAPVPIDREEPAFAARLSWQREGKEAIAAATAELVGRFRTIALDVGTTTFFMARHLRDSPHAKIFTNSLRIAAALSGGAAEAYLAGGRVRTDEHSVFGATAVAQFEALWFDVAVIGVSGITAEGFYDYAFEDAEMKRVYLRRAGLKVLVSDATKFGRMSLVHVGTLSEIDILVTNAQPPIALAAALAENGVEVRVVPGQ
jgi:DeoR family glycerol-3-phosphate regulon repressor